MGRIRNGVLRELVVVVAAAIDTGVSRKSENFPNASDAYMSVIKLKESWVF